MPSSRRLAWTLTVGLSFAAAIAAQPAPDPLAAAVARWQERIRSAPSSNDDVREVRSSAAPRVEEAARALAAGRRWAALARMERVWPDLEAADYQNGIAADRRSRMDALEHEWRRLGPELAKIDRPGARPELAPLPAAARAIAEAALAQAPVYYHASLDYGRNTAPEYGFYYLGAALAQRDLARWIARLPGRRPGVPALAPRDVSFEIAAAGNELARAYLPPRSIDSHAEFIRISALLKEAQELAAAGAHYGALERLLDARARFAHLIRPERSLSAADAVERGRTVSAALDRNPGDTSLQRLFLETALFSATDPEARGSGGGEIAAAIFDEVLPRFPALLGPAPERPPDRKAEVTVTLVRWPYT